MVATRSIGSKLFGSWALGYRKTTHAQRSLRTIGAKMTMSDATLIPAQIAILGTGSMARQHAERFAAIDCVSVVAGIDVDQARAEAFCQRHEINRAFGSLPEGLAWGEFDAVANVTPDNAHYPTTLEITKAGKQVFCEKPLALNYAQAEEQFDFPPTDDGFSGHPRCYNKGGRNLMRDKTIDVDARGQYAKSQADPKSDGVANAIPPPRSCTRTTRPSTNRRRSHRQIRGSTSAPKLTSATDGHAKDRAGRRRRGCQPGIAGGGLDQFWLGLFRLA